VWNYNTEVGRHWQWNNSNYRSLEPKRKFGLNTERHNYQLRFVISYQSGQPEIPSQDVFFSSIVNKNNIAYTSCLFLHWGKTWS